MAEPIRSFADALAFALTLPDAELGTSYREPAAKLRSNGRTFVNVGHEPDSSFVLRLDPGVIDLLIETDPQSFWQSPHYLGSGAVLVRFDSPDPARVRDAIVRAHAHAAALKPVKPRSR